MHSLFLPVLAVVAGVLSFTSPCALPLLPGYVSYVSGLSSSEVASPKRRALVLRSSIGFVTGFTLVFTAMGASSTLLGSLLLTHLPVILRVAGAVIVVLGLATAGVLKVPWVAKERRFDLSALPRGPRGSVPLGMAFAFGWTPCIGPVLATVLSLASTSGTVAWGASLLALYSLGLGVPFLALALGLSRLKGSLAWLRAHGRAIEILSGALLSAVGVLFLTGVWGSLLLPFQARLARLGWPPL